MLKVYNLGKKGFDYFNDNCKLYINFVQLMTDNKVSVKNIYTFVPEDCLSTNLFNNFTFSIGAKSTNIKAVFAEFIEKYIEMDRDNYVYVNEFISTKSTIKSDMARCEVSTKWKENYIMMGEQIAYYIEGIDLDKYEVLETIFYANGLFIPYDIGFISDYLPASKEPSTDEVNRIFKGIKLAFCGAYDGEGIIIAEINDGEVLRIFNKLDIPYTLEELGIATSG